MRSILTLPKSSETRRRILLAPEGRDCAKAVPGCPAVAHVKSEETLQWWRFDDEATSLMERGPVGECSDHGVAPTTDKNGAPAKVRQQALMFRQINFLRFPSCRNCCLHDRNCFA